MPKPNAPECTFCLPDLGEGLTEARLTKWCLDPDRDFELDQSIAIVETAKTAVELPAPCAGHLIAHQAEPGDMVQVGSGLFRYRPAAPGLDSGSVVGQLPNNTTFSKPARQSTQTQIAHGAQRPRALPAVRQIAAQLGINLNTLSPTGSDGQITLDDLSTVLQSHNQHCLSGLSPARSEMAGRLTHHAQTQIIQTTLTEQADLSDWQTGEDLSIRLIQAIVEALKIVPAINGHILDNTYTQLDTIHLGIAVDHIDALYCPVIDAVDTLSHHELRLAVDHIKSQPQQFCSTPPSFVLSNIGMIAGLYATPMVLAPSVAILAIGRRHQIAGVNPQGDIESRTVLPLSLSFDHRAITGADAARFLAQIIRNLA